MSDMNVQNLLSQMRALEAQAKGQTGAAQMGPESLSINDPQGVKNTDFSEVLSNSINAVNDAMKTSGKMASDFEKGNSDITMAQLAITMEKASVSFQAMTQVRNKLLTAYQEIMNMPV